MTVGATLLDKGDGDTVLVRHGSDASVDTKILSTSSTAPITGRLSWQQIR